MTTKKKSVSPVVASSKPTLVVAAVAEALRFSRSMAPKNKGVKQPSNTPKEMRRNTLAKNKQKMLDVGLQLVWEDGFNAGKTKVLTSPIKEMALAKPDSSLAPVVMSEAERIGKLLLDSKITTTKAMLLLQAARAKFSK
jgi:hypothetical protein